MSLKSAELYETILAQINFKPNVNIDFKINPINQI